MKPFFFLGREIPFPDSEFWFERVWRDFREGAVFDS
jgi:hypothetical protein